MWHNSSWQTFERRPETTGQLDNKRTLNEWQRLDWLDYIHLMRHRLAAYQALSACDSRPLIRRYAARRTGRHRPTLGLTQWVNIPEHFHTIRRHVARCASKFFLGTETAARCPLWKASDMSQGSVRRYCDQASLFAAWLVGSFARSV